MHNKKQNSIQKGGKHIKRFYIYVQVYNRFYNQTMRQMHECRRLKNGFGKCDV